MDTINKDKHYFGKFRGEITNLYKFVNIDVSQREQMVINYTFLFLSLSTSLINTYSFISILNSVVYHN